MLEMLMLLGTGFVAAGVAGMTGIAAQSDEDAAADAPERDDQDYDLGDDYEGGENEDLLTQVRRMGETMDAAPQTPETVPDEEAIAESIEPDVADDEAATPADAGPTAEDGAGPDPDRDTDQGATDRDADDPATDTASDADTMATVQAALAETEIEADPKPEDAATISAHVAHVYPDGAVPWAEEGLNVPAPESIIDRIAALKGFDGALADSLATGESTSTETDTGPAATGPDTAPVDPETGPVDTDAGTESGPDADPDADPDSGAATTSPPPRSDEDDDPQMITDFRFGEEILMLALPEDMGPETTLRIEPSGQGGEDAAVVLEDAQGSFIATVIKGGYGSVSPEDIELQQAS